MVYAIGIDEEAAGDARVVDASGLRSAHCAGDGDHVEDSAYFVIGIRDVRGSVIDTVAVVAGRLVVVVLAQQLVEGSGDLGAGIVDGGEAAIAGAEEAVSDSGVVNVETIGGQEVVDADDLGHHGVGEVFIVEAVGQHQRESLVLIEVVIAGNYIVVVDAQQLGKGNVGVAEDDVAESVALLGKRGSAKHQRESQNEGQLKAFHGNSPLYLAAVGRKHEFGLLIGSRFARHLQPASLTYVTFASGFPHGDEKNLASWALGDQHVKS